MVLFINTAAAEESIALFEGDKLVAQKKWIGHFDESEKVLRHVLALMKKRKVTWDDLKAVRVNKGPGHFSSVRIGVTIANTLGFALKIPVYGVSGEKFDMMKLEKNVKPFYHKPPNITLPKK